MQNQEFYFSTGIFIRNFMCLADSGQQTTVVMVVAYTVPKRAIPVGDKAILALPEWN
ncbi:hypothetical protein [Rhizobium sp. GCM10022189]|uniref:hypothetical protein n=1 Tax=Rhizobium sp. GCM10022189 TaxID=3252654 RepID=UPI003609A1B0